MSESTVPRLLAVSPLPPDLHATLKQKFGLTDYSALGGSIGKLAPAPGFNIAVTMGVYGADAGLFDAMPDLRLVACNGAGLDRIDLKQAKARGIAVCHTPDELAEDVADGAIALTYAVMRKVVFGDRFVRSGQWTRERPTPSTRVAGKTMGVVGLGRIGRRIADRAAAIGMHVAYHGRKPQAGISYPFEPDIAALAAKADVLALACPGGEQTHHLVNGQVLEKLGSGGYLVNVSRGAVVDESALLDALERGTIAGAALDVFASEPNVDRRFLALDNVVLQPHSTSITHETRAAMVARLLSDIDSFLAGRPFHDAAAAATAAD
jgi:lactate dehydrogenase-like 2-hydroxyacid dehydrogenase